MLEAVIAIVLVGSAIYLVGYAWDKMFSLPPPPQPSPPSNTHGKRIGSDF